jgi:protein-tyrosine phosphatase
MAEAAFHACVAETGLAAGSAGGRHEDENTVPRAVAVLEKNGHALAQGRLRALRRLAPTERDAAGVRPLRSYAPTADDGDLDVPVP